MDARIWAMFWLFPGMAVSCSSSPQCEVDTDCPFPQVCLNNRCEGGLPDGGNGGESMPCTLNCPSGTSCTTERKESSTEMFCRDASGRKTGPARSYDEQGRLVAEYSYNQEGRLDGKINYYNEDGSVAMTGNYSNGKKQGTFTSYYPNGQKQSEVNYQNDVLDGPCKEWYENGNLQWEGQYKDGAYHGHWIYYYPSGNKEKEGDYNLNVQCGIWQFYYDSQSQCPSRTCQMESSGILIGFVECGQWLYYWPNGQKKAEGNYYGVTQEGKADRCGHWNEYDENGNVILSQDYNPCPDPLACETC